MQRFLKLWLFCLCIRTFCGFCTEELPNFPTEGATSTRWISSDALHISRKIHEENCTYEEIFVKEDSSWSLYCRKRHQILPSEPKTLVWSFEDGENNVLCRRVSVFDKNNHPLKETIFGNLSGQSLSEEESYSTYYHYSSDGRLLEVQEDNGRMIQHVYDANKRLSGKFFGESQKIEMRVFFSYDEQERLSKVAIDDGDTLDVQDLEGVSARKIIVTHHDDIGFMTEEGYLDLNTQEEVFVSKIVEDYDFGDNPHRSIACYVDDTYLLSKLISHDPFTQTTTMIDSTGHGTNMEFDERGALTLWYDTQTDHTKTYTYDENHRLTEINEIDPDGKPLHCEEETIFTYDQLGRLTHEQRPEILNENDDNIRPQNHRYYDARNRLIKVIDENGHSIHIDYNAYNKPIRIQYPDGTSEGYFYNLDGTLKEWTDKSGIITSYSYDCLGRITSKETLSPHRELIRRENYTHSLFGVSSLTDAEGITTFFYYDHVGRLRKSEKVVGNKTYSIAFKYDARGNLRQKKEIFGNTTEDISVTHYHRNADGNIIALSLETGDGKQQIHQELAKKTSSSCEESYYTTNDRDQIVEQSLTSHSQGSVTTTFDALGRPEKIEKRNLQGQLIAYQELRHDALGNKVLETNAFIEKGTIVNMTTTAWRYGPCSRLEALIENAGTSTPAETLYEYDEHGKLRTIIKPDKAKIEYRYDLLGNLSQRWASNGSFHYEYLYDNNGRLIQVNDLNNHTVTYRTYSVDGHLLCEQLGNKLTLQNEYDSRGRRSRLLLSDGSSVNYQYQGVLLKEIQRYDRHRQQRYSYMYDDYDLSGRLITSTMIGSLGRISYCWNSSLKKLTSISSPFWTEVIPESACDSRGNILQLETCDFLGNVAFHYAYDDQEQLVDEFGIDVHSYRYDSLGNRIAKDNQCYVVNDHHQLIQKESDHYAYDANGNLVKKIQADGVTLFQYDALNRLTKITKPSDYCVCYTYDALDRRLSERRYCWDAPGAAWSAQGEYRYLYDGDNEIGVVDDQGQTKQLRILGLGYGAEIGASVALEINSNTNTKTYAPLHNHSGSVVCIIDLKDAKPVEIYRYNGYGEESLYNSSGEKLASSAAGNPWRFSSKRLDEMSGLVYFGKRYYDPTIGRWITQDPLHFQDGPNRYTYVHNNPVNLIDHYGLFSIETFFNDITTTTVDYCYNFLGSTFKKPYEKLLDYYRSLSQNLYTQGEDVVKSVLGENLSFLIGFTSDVDMMGCFGKGETSNHVRITFLNGILCPFDYTLQQVEQLSNAHGYNNIHYVHRSSAGWTYDVAQTILVKVGGYITPQARNLAAMWKALIEEMKEGHDEGLIIHYTHSFGSTDTQYALSLLSPEQQKMIRVYTFGASTFLSNPQCENVINFISYRDGVAIFDPIGYAKGFMGISSDIQFLGSPLDGMPFTDHLFCQDTYRAVWEQLGKEFIEAYGSL